MRKVDALTKLEKMHRAMDCKACPMLLCGRCRLGLLVEKEGQEKGDGQDDDLRPRAWQVEGLPQKGSNALYAARFLHDTCMERRACQGCALCVNYGDGMVSCGVRGVMERRRARTPCGP